MYLFSRFRHVNSASIREGVAAAVEVAGMASTITGLDVGAWMTIASPDVARVNWSAMFENLDELQTATEKLAASTDYGDWVDAHDNLYDGPTEDALVQIVHGAPDPERTVNYVAGVETVCANGKLSAGLSAGVELAEAFTKITGSPILFAVRRTGLYGGVLWISGAETLGELGALEETLFADSSWAPLVDQHGPAFEPGGETVWFQRLS
jgi:hypothetical protein